MALGLERDGGPAYHMMKGVARHMSAHPQRGRAVQRRQSGGTRTFYMILAGIVIIGIAVLGIVVLSARRSTAGSSPLLNRPPLNAPVGQTPEGYWYKGKPDAPVTVIEYGDFQCPYCGLFANTQSLAIDHDYVETGKIKYVFHDFPLPMHANAVAAAEAARGAGDQNAFWAMHDMLFAKQQEWSDLSDPSSRFADYAQQLKLDRAAFTSALASGKYQTVIAQAQQDGVNAGINATPTFVINGQQYESSQLRAAIDAALAAKQ
jgi:protein-disulfide isomerase